MKLVVQKPDVREVSVRLSLAGGQSFSLALPPEHPLLARLLRAVAKGRDTAGDRNGWFQIPIDGGRASLAFGAHQVVAVMTDPAVLIEGRTATKTQPTAFGSPVMAPFPVGTAPSAITPSAAVAAAAAASAASGYGDRIRHAVVQLDQFLSDSEVAWLLELTLAAESRFRPSRLSSYRADYRQSLMLSAPHEVWEFMTARIRTVMPDVMQQLQIGRFTVGNIDCQITANVDGSYFKAHTDAGHDGPIKRQLTYVYYFNRAPKGFTGGELRIYDDTLQNGKLAVTDTYRVVEPRHNSIVFFQAAVMHEVMPVAVPSKQFRDARFTVNGWVERA